MRPKDLDIGLNVLGMAANAAAHAGRAIESNSLPTPDLWTATVDPGQLETALLNLVLNARDAMPSGGRLTIEAAQHLAGESDADVRRSRGPANTS